MEDVNRRNQFRDALTAKLQQCNYKCTTGVTDAIGVTVYENMTDENLTARFQDSKAQVEEAS
ncbi:hypothetical protein Q5752_003876 [Cryptotrichosporon argae]